MRMECGTTCDICNIDYNESVFIPKILRCTHTFCLPCLNNLIENKAHCPTCRETVDVDKEGKDYPTNYWIFNVLNHAKKEDSNQMASLGIGAMKINCADRTSEISREIDHFLTQLECLVEKNNIKRKQDAENEIVDLYNALNAFNTLENRYKKKMKISIISALIDSTDIRISSFENSDEYLSKIYSRLQENEVIYAVKNVDDVVKYGKVSFQENLLLFHSLSEDEKPDHSSLIWFDDLKDCVSEENFFSFLKLSCNENGIIRLVTIKMLKCPLASTFITLCTGECEQLYKESYYERNALQDRNVLGFFNFNEIKFTKSTEHIDYNTEMKDHKKINKSDVVVTFENTGVTYFLKMLNNIVPTYAVGTVESPHDLETCLYFSAGSKKLTMLQSGICMKL